MMLDYIIRAILRAFVWKGVNAVWNKAARKPRKRQDY